MLFRVETAPKGETKLPAAAGVWPREEGENGSRVSGLVAEIEVIGSRIVEIDRALDQALSEYIPIKIHVALGITSNRCEMM